MKPKTGEVGAMVPVSKKSVCALCVCVVCAHGLSPVSYLKNLEFRKLEMGGFPITANYAIFRANYAFYPANYAF